MLHAPCIPEAREHRGEGIGGTQMFNIKHEPTTVPHHARTQTFREKINKYINKSISTLCDRPRHEHEKSVGSHLAWRDKVPARVLRARLVCTAIRASIFFFGNGGFWGCILFPWLILWVKDQIENRFWFCVCVEKFSNWFENRLEMHKETDSDPMLELIRFAADGAWLNLISIMNEDSVKKARDIRQRLLNMTFSM